MKTPDNREECPDDPEPADEGDFQMEYSWVVVQPNTGAVYVPSDNLEY
jgi:hypothetical protein